MAAAHRNSLLRRAPRRPQPGIQKEPTLKHNTGPVKQDPPGRSSSATRKLGIGNNIAPTSQSTALLYTPEERCELEVLGIRDHVLRSIEPDHADEFLDAKVYIAQDFELDFGVRGMHSEDESESVRGVIELFEYS